MKKIICISAALIFCLAMVITSCKKEQINSTVSTPSSVGTEKILAQLEEINHSYIDGVSITKKKKWWQVLGADMVGAVGGAIAGNVIGACLGGVGASLGALGRVNPGNNEDTPNYNWAEHVELTPPSVDRSDNPYDFVGQFHNDVVAAVALNIDIKAVNEKPELMLDLVQEGFTLHYDNDQLSEARESMLPAWLNLMSATNPSNNPDEMISICRDMGYVNETVSAILTEYILAVEYLDEINEINAITLDYEAVIANADLREDDKAQIQQCLATARYSAAYWNNIYNQLENN